MAPCRIYIAITITNCKNQTIYKMYNIVSLDFINISRIMFRQTVKALLEFYLLKNKLTCFEIGGLYVNVVFKKKKKFDSSDYKTNIYCK